MVLESHLLEVSSPELGLIQQQFLFVMAGTGIPCGRGFEFIVDFPDNS